MESFSLFNKYLLTVSSVPRHQESREKTDTIPVLKTLTYAGRQTLLKHKHGCVNRAKCWEGNGDLSTPRGVGQGQRLCPRTGRWSWQLEEGSSGAHARQKKAGAKAGGRQRGLSRRNSRPVLLSKSRRGDRMGKHQGQTARGLRGRVTAVACLPRDVLGRGTFSARTGSVPGRPGQVGHPGWRPH